MKTLHLRRHSIKDGPNNTIGEKGFALAFHEGDIASNLFFLFARVFFGPLIRTAQTAMTFMEGLRTNLTSMPVVFGLGDDALFAEMVNDAFKAAVKAGMSNFNALRCSHNPDQIHAWAMTTRAAVQGMFDQMGDHEIAIGFFHSPTIELAAYACGATSCDEGWDRLNDLEGLIFVQDDDGDIYIKDKISVIRT